MFTDLPMNLSTLERFVRIIIGGVILMLAAYLEMSTLLIYVLVSIGLILMVTGLSGYCPIYGSLKYSSAKK